MRYRKRTTRTMHCTVLRTRALRIMISPRVCLEKILGCGICGRRRIFTEDNDRPLIFVSASRRMSLGRGCARISAEAELGTDGTSTKLASGAYPPAYRGLFQWWKRKTFNYQSKSFCEALSCSFVTHVLYYRARDVLID